MSAFRMILRVISLIAFAGGTIRVWEYYRDDALQMTRAFTGRGHAVANVVEPDKQKVVDKAEVVYEQKKPEPKVESKDEGLLTFEDGFAKIASKAINSVVNIATLQVTEEDSGGIPDIFRGTPFDDMMRDFFDAPHKKRTKRTHALGSGFIVRVDKDKFYVVTNNHVVEKATKVIVYLHDKTEIAAEIYASDQRTDIAVLVVDTKDSSVSANDIKPIEWGNSDEISEGNWVIAIGNPFGFGSTVTSGIVSAKGRDLNSRTSSMVEDLIQHSAAINMGNSGGCLLDIHGKVIGINNAIISNSGGNIGIGFAIPSNLARTTVEQLIEHKRTLRGWFGVSVQKVDAGQAESIGLIEKRADKSEVFGAYVSKIVDGSPAADAGMKVGDIIIEIDGTRVSAKNSIQSIIGRTEIGRTIKVRVWRQKDTEKWESVDLNVVVGDFDKACKDGLLDEKSSTLAGTKDTEKAVELLGITVSRIPDRYKDEYPQGVSVFVTKVDEDKSSFYGSVFAVGDGIISAANKKIDSVECFYNVVKEAAEKPENKGRPIPFVIVRHGMQMMVATTVDCEKATTPPKDEKAEAKDDKASTEAKDEKVEAKDGKAGAEAKDEKAVKPEFKNDPGKNDSGQKAKKAP
jgi:serine protease Do